MKGGVYRMLTFRYTYVIWWIILHSYQAFLEDSVSLFDYITIMY